MICMLSLILEILLAFANIPHPNSQVNMPVLFILEILLCRVGFTLYRALKKASKNSFSEGDNYLVGDW